MTLLQWRDDFRIGIEEVDHERLLDDLRDLMDEQADGTPLDEEQFAARLAQWFSGHFQTHDAGLHRFLGA
jgi:hemerythrin